MNRLIDLLKFIGFDYDNRRYYQGYHYTLNDMSYYVGLPIDNDEEIITFSIYSNLENTEYDRYYINNKIGIENCIKNIMSIKDLSISIRKYKINKLLNG